MGRADRYEIRLYQGGSLLLSEETNLDASDDRMLRSTLERLVKQKRRTLRLDLSDYRIDVHSFGFGTRRVATCTVTRAGRTKVRR
jgi:hypothetical protein